MQFFSKHNVENLFVEIFFWKNMYKIGSFSIIIVENSVESVKKPQYYGIFIKIDFVIKIL